MSVFHTEDEFPPNHLSEDPLVENEMAYMICMVVGETLGLSETEPILEPQQGPPPAPPPSPEGRTGVVQTDPTLDMPREFY